jgi:predicted transposase YbfD/YdcC
LKPPPEGSRRPLPPDDPPPPSPDRIATSWDKGHGRIEKRTLEATTILTVGSKWSGLKQGFRITRERTAKGKTTVEVALGITSLSPERANAAALRAFLRTHWHIENKLHYVRDVTLGEDACRVRKGTAPQVLAALRNAVIHLLSAVEAESHPEAIELLQLRPEEAKRLIGVPQSE